MTPENEKEHKAQSSLDEVLQECEICCKLAILKPMLYNNDEDKMLCPECWGSEEARGDMEYERWKDEQSELGERKEYDPDDPDHERDIREERA